jgi:hypothetical protein
MHSRRSAIRSNLRRLRPKRVGAVGLLFGDGAEYRSTDGAIAWTGRGHGSGLRYARPARLMRHYPSRRALANPPVISAAIDLKLKLLPGGDPGRHLRPTPPLPRTWDAHARARGNRPRGDEPCPPFENAAPGRERRSHNPRSAKPAANRCMFQITQIALHNKTRPL